MPSQEFLSGKHPDTSIAVQSEITKLEGAVPRALHALEIGYGIMPFVQPVEPTQAATPEVAMPAETSANPAVRDAQRLVQEALKHAA